MNKNYIYFYYPIKDINMSKNKFILYQSYQNKTNDDLFCNNLNDIYKAIKTFLNIKTKFDLFTINLFTENFNIINSDNQLMEKIEKYKILYAKVIKSSKIKNCFSHGNFKNFNLSDKDADKLFNNKLIKNSFSFNIKPFNKTKKNFSSNTLDIEENDEKSINQKKITSYKFSKHLKTNKKSFNDITNSLDELILDEMNFTPSYNENKRNYFRYFLNNKINKNPYMIRNNTINIFSNFKIKKNKISIIKQKELLNSNINNLFNFFNPDKKCIINHKLYLAKINSKKEIKNWKNMNKNLNSFENIRTNKFRLKNNFLKTFNFEIKSNKFNLYDEIKKKNVTFYNLKNDYNPLSNEIEGNQILFISFNTLIKNFILEKLDNYISNEEIKILFDIENIVINIKNFNIDEVNILYIFIQEFLLYLYLSNYINLYHKEFCSDLNKIINEEDYMDLNKIFSIYSFRDLIHGIKNIFDSIKSNKEIMTEKLRENYDKNEKIISFTCFILLIAYNRYNFATLFQKELLFDLFNTIDINFNKGNINHVFYIEHYIKFRLFLTRNEIVNEDMKRNFMKKFFNNITFNNNDFNKDIIIIKLRTILTRYESIMKIVNKEELDDSFLIDSYNKLIDYYNF